jgi:glucosamine kinase
VAAESIVLGIDGGGTYTRVMVVNCTGQVLSFAESGGANPFHNANGKIHVQNAIREAIAQAGKRLQDAVCIVSGFAGLDQEADHRWAEEFTRLDNWKGRRLQVNDAVIAHAGALRSKPGIIVILGTGSNIFAINEEKRHIRNYDFHHYAAAAARHLSFETIYRVIARDYESEDHGLVEEVLEHWNVPTVEALRDLGMDGFIDNTQDRNRRFGAMAPLITKAAAQGIPLAQKVCDAGAQAVEAGVRLLGECFKQEEVTVSLIGSVARSSYMSKAVTERLGMTLNKSYNIVKPAFSSTAGAAMMALSLSNIDVNSKIEQVLSEHPAARFKD